MSFMEVTIHESGTVVAVNFDHIIEVFANPSFPLDDEGDDDEAPTVLKRADGEYYAIRETYIEIMDQLDDA